MEEGFGIRTEASEESSAESKGRNFRQVKEREEVECCLSSVDGGKRTRISCLSVLPPTFPTSLPGVGCSLLFLRFSLLISHPRLVLKKT